MNGNVGFDCASTKRNKVSIMQKVIVINNAITLLFFRNHPKVSNPIPVRMLK